MFVVYEKTQFTDTRTLRRPCGDERNLTGATVWYFVRPGADSQDELMRKQGTISGSTIGVTVPSVDILPGTYYLQIVVEFSDGHKEIILGAPFVVLGAPGGIEEV